MAKNSEQTENKSVETKTEKRYVAAMAFQDSKEYAEGSEPKQYEIGDDVSHFDANRISRAVEYGIIKEAE